MFYAEYKKAIQMIFSYGGRKFVFNNAILLKARSPHATDTDKTAIIHLKTTHIWGNTFCKAFLKISLRISRLSSSVRTLFWAGARSTLLPQRLRQRNTDSVSAHAQPLARRLELTGGSG